MGVCWTYTILSYYYVLGLSGHFINHITTTLPHVTCHYASFIYFLSSFFPSLSCHPYMTLRYVFTHMTRLAITLICNLAVFHLSRLNIFQLSSLHDTEPYFICLGPKGYGPRLGDP